TPASEPEGDAGTGDPTGSWVHESHALLGSRLPGLAADLLTLVPNALALVRLGRTDPANFGGHLAHDLFIGPFDTKRRGVLDHDLDPGRHPEIHRVREAHDQRAPERLRLGFIADALQLERAGIALVNAVDHVL